LVLDIKTPAYEKFQTPRTTCIVIGNGGKGFLLEFAF